MVAEVRIGAAESIPSSRCRSEGPESILKAAEVRIRGLETTLVPVSVGMTGQAPTRKQQMWR